MKAIVLFDKMAVNCGTLLYRGTLDFTCLRHPQVKRAGNALCSFLSKNVSEIRRVSLQTIGTIS